MKDFLRPVGSTVAGHFEVVRVLSQKGMSNVYACMDTSLNKLVCLKEIIKSQAGRDSINYHALLNETDLLSRLNHAGIPRIISRRENEERVSILMDLVSGEDLEDIVNHEGPMAESEAVAKMLQLGTIVTYLHNLPNPVFYRDLKLSNILIQDGNVKLLDFGISVEITPQNRVITQPLGTKGYAAPEQAKKGLPYDLRSDIYSFGVTLFALLTGKNPASVKSFNLRDYSPTFSKGLSNVLMKCTDRDPNNRFQTIEEVLVALRDYEHFDEAYISKSRRKIRTVSTLLVASIALAATSGGLAAAGMNTDNNQYSALVRTADISGSLSDYRKAIDARPANIGPYFDMVDSAKQDGVFSDDEEVQLLSAVNQHYTSISTDSRFSELAYNLGHLYWFFYKSESGASGQVLSPKWFKIAVDGQYNTEQAKVLYNLGSFQRDIASAVQTSSDTGMYRAYWNALRDLDVSSTGEVVTLQMYNYILDAITGYTNRLQTDGVPLSEINEQLDIINKYLKDNPNPTEGRPVELSKTLEIKLEAAPGLLKNIYK